MNVSPSAPTSDGRCPALRRAYPATALSARGLAVAAVALFALPLSACGEEETEEPPEAPVETAQAVPPLPPGWNVSRNDHGGFALGVPPGWQAKRKGTESQLKSPDRLAVVTVKPDRTNEAIEADLEELADATGVQLGTQFEDFELGDTEPIGHRYDAYSVTATGSSQGVAQDLEVYLLRRGELATLTVIAQRNEKFGTGRYVPTIERIVRSIRSRPVG